uniref:START domain-containing protein n=1 Tax=Euplotes harpa TaxID=151035 RepID=A0A7S3J7N0_9SPIT|mmetsp:Transcript_2409/g.3120  ORF Transcript_2409/g.3120 Transcript_2409/m.3120 type:complete len:102 (+) Transcript_2409:476-781(+)
MDEVKDWDIKVDEPDVKLWIAKHGSFLNESLPFVHSEICFDVKYPLELVIDCISEPTHKSKWDENIDSCRVIENISFNEVVCHTVYREIPFFATTRDFLEK